MPPSRVSGGLHPRTHPPPAVDDRSSVLLPFRPRSLPALGNYASVCTLDGAAASSVCNARLHLIPSCPPSTPLRLHLLRPVQVERGPLVSQITPTCCL